MMVKVFRRDCEGYTIDLAATESLNCGPALKAAEQDLEATGKFKQLQPIAAAYLSPHSLVRKI